MERGYLFRLADELGWDIRLCMKAAKPLGITD